jgi:hypothetical protein
MAEPYRVHFDAPSSLETDPRLGPPAKPPPTGAPARERSAPAGACDAGSPAPQARRPRRARPDPHGRVDAVHERLPGVAPVVGEDHRGQNGDPEHVAELADRVVAPDACPSSSGLTDESTTFATGAKSAIPIPESTNGATSSPYASYVSRFRPSSRARPPGGRAPSPAARRSGRSNAPGIGACAPARAHLSARHYPCFHGSASASLEQARHFLISSWAACISLFALSISGRSTSEPKYVRCLWWTA